VKEPQRSGRMGQRPDARGRWLLGECTPHIQVSADGDNLGWARHICLVAGPYLGCIWYRAPLLQSNRSQTTAKSVATQCCTNPTTDHQTTTCTGRLPLQRDARHVLCFTAPQGTVCFPERRTWALRPLPRYRKAPGTRVLRPQPWVKGSHPTTG